MLAFPPNCEARAGELKSCKYRGTCSTISVVPSSANGRTFSPSCYSVPGSSPSSQLLCRRGPDAYRYFEFNDASCSENELNQNNLADFENEKCFSNDIDVNNPYSTYSVNDSANVIQDCNTVETNLGWSPGWKEKLFPHPLKFKCLGTPGSVWEKCSIENIETHDKCQLGKADGELCGPPIIPPAPAPAPTTSSSSSLWIILIILFVLVIVIGVIVYLIKKGKNKKGFVDDKSR